MGHRGQIGAAFIVGAFAIEACGEVGVTPPGWAGSGGEAGPSFGGTGATATGAVSHGGAGEAATGGTGQAGDEQGDAGDVGTSDTGGASGGGGRPEGGRVSGTAGEAGEAGRGAAAGGTTSGQGGVGGAEGDPLCGGIEGTAGAGECLMECAGDLTDVWLDPANCGECGTKCVKGSQCLTGNCIEGLCRAGAVDCTAEFGCETRIDTPQNCGDCGVIAARSDNVEPTCTCDGPCAGGMCEPGFANCERSNDDCETPAGSAGSCFPKLVRSWCVSDPLTERGAQHSSVFPAVHSDGSVFVAAQFDLPRDFDPSAGVDERTPVGTIHRDWFITRFAADGSYGWTRTWTGNLVVRDIASSPDGGALLLVEYGSMVDLDPGPGTDSDSADEPGVGLIKLSAAGEFVWARRWQPNFVRSSSIAVDDANRVYVAGVYEGGLDADPSDSVFALGGDGGVLHDVLLSLDANGLFRWARTVGSECESEIQSVAVAGDELWAVGSTRSDCVSDQLARAWNVKRNSGSIAIALHADLDGSIRNLHGVAPRGRESASFGTSVVIGSSGSVYVGGEFNGIVDFLSGPGSRERTAYGGTFIMTLDREGALRDVYADAEDYLQLIRGASDAVIAFQRRRFFRLAPDGAPGFTIGHRRVFTPRPAVSDAAGYVEVGLDEPTCDRGLFVARYDW